MNGYIESLLKRIDELELRLIQIERWRDERHKETIHRLSAAQKEQGAILQGASAV